MPSTSTKADVGILGRDDQNGDAHNATLHDDTTEKSDVEGKEGDDTMLVASRLDVYNALGNAKFVGSSSFAGKADGTMTIPALPTTPGLFIHDIDRISLPITPGQAKLLKAHSWKTNDDGESFIESYHFVRKQSSHTFSMCCSPFFLSTLSTQCSRISIKWKSIA
jgi:hypothetical protein